MMFGRHKKDRHDLVVPHKTNAALEAAERRAAEDDVHVDAVAGRIVAHNFVNHFGERVEVLFQGR